MNSTQPVPSSQAPQGRFDSIAIGLHWLLALALTVAFCVGVYMEGLPFSPQKLKLINWHKWAGVTILLLSVVRLLWRWTHRPPPLSARAEAAMPTWQRWAHRAVQGLMYALFLAVPLLGWAYSSAAGFPIVWFGVWPLPDLLAADKALAEAIKPWHGWAAFALAALVLVHVAAVLKHQLIDRDGVLSRMRPGR